MIVLGGGCIARCLSVRLCYFIRNVRLCLSGIYRLGKGLVGEGWLKVSPLLLTLLCHPSFGSQSTLVFGLVWFLALAMVIIQRKSSGSTSSRNPVIEGPYASFQKCKTHGNPTADNELNQ